MSAKSSIHVLLAACDVRDSGSVSVGDDSSSMSTSPPLTPRAVDPVTRGVDRRCRANGAAAHRGVNASRDRMKQEMHHLRDSVAELQRQLEEIKKDHMRRSPRQPTAPSQSTTQLVAAWEAMARGQCEQRYRAEVENVKLRKMLDEQVKIVQTLERVLAKRRRSEQLFGRVGAGSKRSRQSSTLNPIDNPRVFEDLNALLPSLYAQANLVFDKNCFLTRQESFRNVDVRHADEIGTYVESTEKRLLPFSIQDTAESMWEFLVYYPDEPTCKDLCKTADLGQDSLQREETIRMQLERFAGEVYVKFIGRRYVESDRVVIVWVGLADPCEIPDSPLEGACIRHTGWMCARASPLAVGTSAMTELVLAQVSVPEFYEAPGDRKRRVCSLTNYLVSSLNWQLDANKQVMDNRLLEKVLARNSSKPSRG